MCDVVACLCLMHCLAKWITNHSGDAHQNWAYAKVSRRPERKTMLCDHYTSHHRFTFWINPSTIAMTVFQTRIVRRKYWAEGLKRWTLTTTRHAIDAPITPYHNIFDAVKWRCPMYTASAVPLMWMPPWGATQQSSKHRILMHDDKDWNSYADPIYKMLHAPEHTAKLNHARTRPK